ncbi:MAG TPA: ABC transporter permease [Pyrinomonadaceae bacterium]|nr:ABC transporter permease [Pyrinomonadaceae bacterium]
MRTIWQDVRYGFRMLLKSRSFTLVALVALALGIGANTAIFSVVNAVLLRPLPYRDPARLVTVLHDGWKPVAPANFLDWREQTRVFDSMAAAQVWGPSLTGHDEPEQLHALQLSANMFDVLGVSASLGRTFAEGEDQPGRDHVVVLSDGIWRRRFGGDRKIVGQQIMLDGEAYTVAGVMPPDFQFAPFWATKAELWSPLSLAARVNDRRGQSLRVFARLKKGVTREQAQADMDAINRRLADEYPEANKGLTVAVDSLHEKAVGNARPALLVLLGAVGFVLLIACANVANLLMARAAARRKEIAVRLALGASRLRVVRQLLTESVMLSLAGGAAGLLLAVWGVDALVALGPEALPRTQTVGLDASVLLFTLALSVVTGLLFGLAPALQTTKPDLNESLKDRSRGATAGRRRDRVRRLLVVAEVALSLVLLVGGGLMLRSFLRLTSVDPGFDPRGVLTMTVSLAGSSHKTDAERAAFFEQLLAQVKTLPGVKSASAINHLPLGGDVWTLGFKVEGRPEPPPGQKQGAVYRVVRPEYFHTMGATLLKGRDFNVSDDAEDAGVVIVNEAFARATWPGEEALGKRITVSDETKPREIVGVVRDLKQGEWTSAPKPEMYLPHAQAASPSAMTIVARTDGDPLKLARPVQAQVWAIDKNLPVSDVSSMEDVISGSVGPQRFNALLLGVFAAAALLLAVVGVYGVMSYTVAERTHEIGARMALGAQARDVLRLVVGQGLALALVGLVVGLVAALALTRLMSGMLYGVSATDPLVFGGVALVLALAALLACLVPARRATKVDPMVALRYE